MGKILGLSCPGQTGAIDPSFPQLFLISGGYNMKKLGAWLAALFLMVGPVIWFGCAQTEEPTADDTQQESAEETPAQPTAEEPAAE
jgi:hypothetical protein